MDTELSSMAEMPALGAPEGPEVEGHLALVCVETDPWAAPMPVFLGSPEEEEEEEKAHQAALGGFGNLAEWSLRTVLHILTKDLPNTVKVSPSLFS
jgi:hypothetical protein